MVTKMKNDPLVRAKAIAQVVAHPPGVDMVLTMFDVIVLITIWQAMQRGEELQFSDLYADEQSLKNVYQGSVSKLSYGRLQKGGVRSDALDLIEHAIDDRDKRKRRLTLTAKGRTVAEALVEALVGQPAPTRTVEPDREPETGKIVRKARKAA